MLRRPPAPCWLPIVGMLASCGNQGAPTRAPSPPAQDGEASVGTTAGAPARAADAAADTDAADAGAAAVAASPALAAEPFTLKQVRLLDGPFRAAMERNAKVLLDLDPDRLLYNVRKYAGLRPKGEIYGGWESAGIAGHTLGHALTALAQQYAATGEGRFRDRILYLVEEMAACQRAYGDGYVGALPPLELQTLRALKQGKVEVQSEHHFKGGAWMPWYTEHKILAGLKDAWTLGEDPQAKDVTLRLADWIDAVTRDLTPSEWQEMLRVEHGGMNETLADIYLLTGDDKYLKLARRFHHEEVMRPLRDGHDELAGKHANSQIPEVIGEARLYEVAGDGDGLSIARTFWQRVVDHHSYVIGGNGEHERFGQPDNLSAHLGPATAETCSTYNMLRLTRHLFSWEPQASHFDFYERALYNHILASQEPKQGMFAYFMPLAPGHFKTWSTPRDSFWCCFGTGLENHGKYGESIYFHGADSLWVNLFIPSRLEWPEKGLIVEQRTNYPWPGQGPGAGSGGSEGRVELRFQPKAPVTLSVRIRAPRWAGRGLKLALNRKPLRVPAAPGSYAEVRRRWVAGDVLRITIPLAVRAEALSDARNKVAFLYGPLVLAGDLGPVPVGDNVPYARDPAANFHHATAQVPVLTASAHNPAKLVRRAGTGRSLVFRTRRARPHDVILRPYNEISYDYTNVYWDVLTPAELRERKAAAKTEAARRADQSGRTIDQYRPGDEKSEREHQSKGEQTSTGEQQGLKFRQADGGWFSFILKTQPGQPLALVCTYSGDEPGGHSFDVVIDGRVIASQALNRDRPGAFFDITYPLPGDLLAGKSSIEVRLRAHPGNIAGGLYGAKVLRSEPAAGDAGSGAASSSRKKRR